MAHGGSYWSTISIRFRYKIPGTYLSPKWMFISSFLSKRFLFFLAAVVVVVRTVCSVYCVSPNRDWNGSISKKANKYFCSDRFWDTSQFREEKKKETRYKKKRVRCGTQKVSSANRSVIMMWIWWLFIGLLVFVSRHATILHTVILISLNLLIYYFNLTLVDLSLKYSG